jgi:hypothetical protein
LSPVVVFTAFSIEAYLNSIGSRHIAFWDSLERLPWKEKVSILHKNVGRDADWGKDPLQFANDVFRLRDKLAHGKAERVFGPACKDLQEAQSTLASAHPKPEWYQGITKEWVLASKDRFFALMTYLGQLYGLHESDYLLSASGGLLQDNEVDA